MFLHDLKLITNKKDDESIRKQFQNLSRIFHPDKSISTHKDVTTSIF